MYNLDDRPLPPPEPGSILEGVMYGTVVNIFALLISVASIGIGIGILLTAGFGPIQWIWMAMLVNRFRREGQTETAKGVLIAAGISTLLSAACWGVLASR